MKKTVITAVSALLVTASPAFAQAAGDAVVGPNGGAVGSIVSVDGDVVTVDTGMHQAALPKAAFAEADAGWSITVTKADLDNMIMQQQAAAQSAMAEKLTPGTPVSGSAGNPIGTVNKVEGDLVEIDYEGSPYKLPKSSFMVTQTGMLALAMTEAEFQAAINGEAPAAEAAADATAEADVEAEAEAEAM